MVSLAESVGALMFLGVIAYAVFAGADFGSGLWDLTAGGDERGAPMRTLIDRAVGPVWEANHVWLIYVLVFLWTGFPAPFAALMETLFIPFGLAGIGIVARGSAFAFRKLAPTLGMARLFGALFALSSVVTPFVLGCIAGAVASGRVPAGGDDGVGGGGDPWSSWTGSTSIVGGVLAVLTCSFLAATFLAAEAERRADRSLLEACRGRAMATGVVTGGVAVVAIVVLERDAPTLFDGLSGAGLPLVAGSTVAGLVALWSLWRHRFAVARVAAVGAVVAVVAGWGVAQHPWILVDEVTLDAGAGARSTLWALVITFGVAGAVVLPALGYLYVLTQRREWIDREHH